MNHNGDHTNLKNDISAVFQHMTKKERLIWVIQAVLSIVIIVIAILGINDICSITTTNTIDLILLMLLFVICSIRFIPGRIVYAVIYLIAAALMGAILIASFFIY